VFRESRVHHDEWDIEWRCMECEHHWIPKRCPCCGDFAPMNELNACPSCGVEWLQMENVLDEP
jgi:hypothetical protein